MCHWKCLEILGNRVTLTPDIAPVVVMATLALSNILRLKPKDDYTQRGSLDEIQSNG